MIQDKNYAGLRDYCSDRIASVISDSIILSKNKFVATSRGLTLEEYEKSLEEKEVDKKVKKGILDKEDGDEEDATTEDDKEKYSA